MSSKGKELMDKGSEHYDKGDYDAAARYYHEAVESFIAEEDDQGQADALLELGNINGILKDFKRAKLYYAGCLILYRRNQDLLGEGYALFGLAQISEKEEEYEKSVDYYRKSFQKFEEPGDQGRADKVLNSMFKAGSQFYDDREYDKALKYYGAVLKLFVKVNDAKKAANTLLQMGNLYLILEDLERADECYKRSLNLSYDINDLIGQGHALAGIGAVQEVVENYDDAKDSYQKSFRKFDEAKDSERREIIPSFIAGANKFPIWNEALTAYKKSSEIPEKIEEPPEEVEIAEAPQEVIVTPEIRFSRRKGFIVLIYLAALILGELAITYFNAELGLLIMMIILFALLLNSSFTDSTGFAHLLRSMMALPIIRIVGLTMPIMQVSTLYWFPIIAIPIFAASYTIIRTQGIGRKDVGLMWGNIPVQLIIASTGIVLGFIEYQILHPQPLIPFFNYMNLVLAGIILIISTGFAEELLFRGIIQNNAIKVFGTLFGILYTALIFTALHIGWNNIFDLIFVFGVALFYGYAFQKTRSLFGVAMSHGLANIILFLVMPFFSLQIVSFFNPLYFP